MSRVQKENLTGIKKSSLGSLPKFRISRCSLRARRGNRFLHSREGCHSCFRAERQKISPFRRLPGWTVRIFPRPRIKQGCGKQFGQREIELEIAGRPSGIFQRCRYRELRSDPPKVGQETTFAPASQNSQRFKRRDGCESGYDARAGVKWKKQFSSQGRVNELQRPDERIGLERRQSAAGTGVTTDPKEVIFQLGVTPTLNKSVILLRLFRKRYFPPKILSPTSRLS